MPNLEKCYVGKPDAAKVACPVWRGLGGNVLCKEQRAALPPYDSGGACHSGNDGHKHWEKEDVIQTTTITHPPATIAGEIQNCTQYGEWCNGVTAPVLSLIAKEPLFEMGHSISLIEGELNGEPFACQPVPTGQPGVSSCSLPLREGENHLVFWAHSTWGDTSYQGTVTVKVDTLSPSVGLDISGTMGDNNYYTSVLQVAAVPTDATSGVATFEVSVDGGAYQSYTSPISFGDGAHTLQFRVVDHAGNVFESPVQNFYVDTLPPSVNMPASWNLGKTVPYDAWDEGSGLAALRVVIIGEEDKFANVKIAWDQQVSGHSFTEDIPWDGHWKDGSVAPPGTYLVRLKVKDLAGNEAFYLGKIIVPEPNYVSPSISPTEAPVVAAEPLAPPAELTQPEDTTALVPSATEGTTTTTQHFTLTSGTASGTAAGSTTSPGILWGTMAAAAIAAASAYAWAATRKRKEAEEAQAAAVKAEVARSKAERAEKQQKQKENYNKQQTLAQAILAYQQKEQQKKEQQAAYNARMEEKMAQRDQQDEANWVAAQVAVKKKDEDKKKAENQQTKLTGYFNSEKQGTPKVLAAPVPGHEPPTGVGTWLDKVKEKVEQAKQWTQDHVVEPAKKTVEKVQDFAAQTVKKVQDFAAQIVKGVQDFSAKTINWVNQKLEDGKQWVQSKYDEAKESVKQKLEETKQLVQTKVEETKKDLKEKWENLTAPQIVRERAYQLYKALPSAGLTNKRNTIPVFRIPAGRLISLGLVESQTASTDANPYARVNANGFSASGSYKAISTTIGVNTENPAVNLIVRVASPVTLTKEGDSANLGYSANVGVQLNRIYDATVSMDVNYVDLSVKTPDVGKGNVRSGVYVEMNAWVATFVAVVAIGLLITPIDEIIAIGAGALALAEAGAAKLLEALGGLRTFPLPH